MFLRKTAIFLICMSVCTVAIALNTEHDTTKRKAPVVKNVRKGKEGTVIGAVPPQSIVGGDEIIPYSRPYLVSIGAGDSGYWGQSCGGSLISPHAVMTAAHCVSYFGFWIPPEWVEFNRHDLFNDTDVVRMYLKDTSQCDGDVIVHPDWDRATTENDVAVLFLPTAVTKISPVTLNVDHEVPISGAPLDVAGWGSTEFGFPSVPSAVTLNYVTNEACTKKPYRWKDGTIVDSMMCAIRDGKCLSIGDVGGPVVLGQEGPIDGPLEPIVQVGIVSSSDSPTYCYDHRFPYRQTRVSKIADWVKDTVCSHTGELCPSSKASKNSKLKKAAENSGCVKVPTFSPMTANPWPTLSPTVTAHPMTAYPTDAPTVTARPMTPTPSWDWNYTNWPTWVPTKAPMSKAHKD